MGGKLVAGCMPIAYSASDIPAMLRVKHLRGAPLDEGRAARADCLAVGTTVHSGDMDVEALQAGCLLPQKIFSPSLLRPAVASSVQLSGLSVS